MKALGVIIVAIVVVLAVGAGVGTGNYESMMKSADWFGYLAIVLWGLVILGAIVAFFKKVGRWLDTKGH